MSEPSPKESAPNESTAREEAQGPYASTVRKKIGSSPRPTKKWCALHYIVAEPPPGFPSSFDLGAAAREEVRQIVKAADSFHQDMYVAAQVDYGDRLGIERKILERPEPKGIHIREEPADSPGDPAVLKNFFKWALRELPAERYAVFFWGHTFGPASLFAPPLRGRRVLGLRELRLALESFKSAEKDLDVVLFKDCWMSTLETACELQGVVRFVVASQALVPIRPAWPYHDLFSALVAHTDGTAPTELVTRLGKFYDKPGHRGLDAAVPFALLDLAQAGIVSHALTELVRALPKPDEEDLSAISRATIGDIALADVRTLCENLHGTSSSDVAKASTGLDVAVSALIKGQYAQTPGYRGVSIFFCPTKQAKQRAFPRGRFIWPLLPFSRYQDFALAKTQWSEIGYKQL